MAVTATTYTVTAQRKNGTSTFLCASMALASGAVRYFDKHEYERVTITAPDGTVLTREALACLMELGTLDAPIAPVV